MTHPTRFRWLAGALLGVPGWACSPTSTHTATPVRSWSRSAAPGAIGVAIPGGIGAPAQLPEQSECKLALGDSDPRTVASDDENERLGLVCFGKPARYVCPL